MEADLRALRAQLDTEHHYLYEDGLLAAWRIERDMSQVALAERSGLTWKRVNELECGPHGATDAELSTIAGVFGVPEDALTSSRPLGEQHRDAERKQRRLKRLKAESRRLEKWVQDAGLDPKHVAGYQSVQERIEEIENPAYALSGKERQLLEELRARVQPEADA